MRERLTAAAAQGLLRERVDVGALLLDSRALSDSAVRTYVDGQMPTRACPTRKPRRHGRRHAEIYFALAPRRHDIAGGSRPDASQRAGSRRLPSGWGAPYSFASWSKASWARVETYRLVIEDHSLSTLPPIWPGRVLASLAGIC